MPRLAPTNMDDFRALRRMAGFTVVVFSWGSVEILTMEYR
jgi:hypothetical protein